MGTPHAVTVKIAGLPLVLYIGKEKKLIELAKEATGETGVLFRACDVPKASVIAAEWKPLALVMTEDTYRVHRAAFDALAWDVGARVVRLSGEGAAMEEVRALVAATVLSARTVRGV